MSSEILQSLTSYQYLKTVLLGACDHVSWWRRFFTPSFSKTIYSVKVEYRDFFISLIPHNFLQHFTKDVIEKDLMPCLTFTSPGRVLASLAYIVCLLDRCKVANVDFDAVAAVLLEALRKRIEEEVTITALDF
nr:MAG: E1B 19K [unidentified adenovirus]